MVNAVSQWLTDGTYHARHRGHTSTHVIEDFLTRAVAGMEADFYLRTVGCLGMLIQFASSSSPCCLIYLGDLQQFFLYELSQLPIHLKGHSWLSHGSHHSTALIKLGQETVSHAEEESHREDKRHQSGSKYHTLMS